MNKTMTLMIGGLIAIAGFAAPAFAADANVTISAGQPGYYGIITIGDAPRPRIIYAQPVIIERVAVAPAPVYMHVPPGHAKKWSKHCHKYNACGQRVYFVNHDWYNTVYVQHHHRQHGNRHEHDDDHDDHDHDKDRGHGKNHGHGKGKKDKD